jgi:hypothetical protein
MTFYGFKILEIKNIVSYSQKNLNLLFLAGILSKMWGTKICPKSFRPKRRFVKSIPGVGEVEAALGLEHLVAVVVVLAPRVVDAPKKMA